MGIKNIIKTIKCCFSRESCYEDRKSKGYLDGDKCYGVVGGGKTTNYLSETCISCPHWTPIDYDYHWR